MKTLNRFILFFAIVFVISLPLPLIVWGWWYYTTGVAERVAYMALLESGMRVVPAQMIVFSSVYLMMRLWRKRS